MKKLIDDLRQKIIDTLDLVDIKPEDFKEDDTLVGGELGIDSIDILELVVMIEKDYGVHIENKEVGEKVFRSLKILAQYIFDNSPLIKHEQ